MSLGLHSAGFESHGFDASERAVAMANENGLAATVVDVFDPDIVETMRSVHPSPVLIHSSSPCRGYSQASASNQSQKQMWNSLTTRAADIVVQMKPLVAIFENVLTARTNENWTRAIARLNSNGYHSVSVCLDACKMSIGVPQTRKRLFVVLCRTSGQDLTVAHKMNEWLEQCKTMMRSRNVTSIADAIPEMADKTLFVFPRRRENQCVFASDRPAPCVRSMILAKPSGSLVQDNPANSGPIEDAVVADVALAAKLCGFPDDFKFGKYKVHNGLALGNVVCPAMGAFVARFAAELIPFAGDGTAPGVQYVSNYPIRPVRFVGAVDEAEDARPRRRRKID
jgi:site-specific DNA-cytosine methylase